MNHPLYQDSLAEVIAHMTPQELAELEAMQGGRQIDPQRRIPTLSRLGEMLGHESVKPALEDWERRGFAGGGEVEGINHLLRNSGRMGDTEIVVLPRPVADLFDKALYGGPQPKNPHTGKREYFIGALLGGLGSVLAPHLGGLIGKGVGAIGNMLGFKGADNFGERVGGAIGTAGQALGNTMASGGNFSQGLRSAAGAAVPEIMQGMQSNPYARAAGTALTGYSNGQNWQDAGMAGLREGAGRMAQQGFGGSGMPQFMQQGLQTGMQNFSQGMPIQRAAMSGMRSAVGGIQNPMMQNLGSNMMGAVDSMAGGMNPMQAMSNQAQNYDMQGAGMMEPAMTGMRDMARARAGGANWMNAGMTGLRGAAGNIGRSFGFGR